jgi:glycosyltransferase involved in cell wall biosynthesis
MRIVHYIKRIWFADGGVVRAGLDLCKAMAERGHDVVLATCDDKDVPAEWKAGAPGMPKVARLPEPTGPMATFTAAARQQIAGLVAGADVVHVHIFWLPSSVQFCSAARRAGKPYVISTHGMLDDWCMTQRGPKKRLFLLLVGNRMFRHAAAVHCTASAEERQSSRWLPPGKTVVIPYVFDLDPFRELPGPERARQKFPQAASGVPVVLFLSRVHEKKGIEVLIEAAALWRDRGLDVRVLIAGTGDPAYEQSLRTLVSQRRLDHIVQFVGLVVGTEKLSLYQAADLFILPTSQENFGLVLPESLACRTPVITTKGVDIWPELEQSGAAVIADTTPQAIADAAAPLLADSARRREMGERGRAWVLETLEPRKVSQQFETMYLAARTSAGRSPGAN